MEVFAKYFTVTCFNLEAVCAAAEFKAIVFLFHNQICYLGHLSMFSSAHMMFEAEMAHDAEEENNFKVYGMASWSTLISPILN